MEIGTRPYVPTDGADALPVDVGLPRRKYISAQMKSDAPNLITARETLGPAFRARRHRDGSYQAAVAFDEKVSIGVLDPSVSLRRR